MAGQRRAATSREKQNARREQRPMPEVGQRFAPLAGQ